MSEEELQEYKAQLASVEEGLQEDPTNDSLLDLKKELGDLIDLLQEALGQQAPKDRISPSYDVGNEDTKTKSRETSVEELPPSPVAAKPTRFAVGDTVLAQWVSGDKQFYQAKVTAVTGSIDNSLYTVRFVNYKNTTETLRGDSVRQFKRAVEQRTTSAPVNKRIADTVPPTPPPTKRPIDASSDKPEKSQKMSQAKLLDNQQFKWQQFAKKGIKSRAGRPKTLGETSMFRSPEAPTGRVGVVGSGRGMTKEKRRERHVFDPDSRID
jgi:survival-of-motor-neuron-related-splicing factor 30